MFANVALPATAEVSLAVRSKERTFHYLPYSFAQSKLEKEFIEACLTLDVFKQRALEIYYNGERGLTEFVIQCYQKQGDYWRHLGAYTPDFLILERNATTFSNNRRSAGVTDARHLCSVCAFDTQLDGVSRL